MTLALKDIGSIRLLLGQSPLAQSPLWTKSVDTIVPQQFVAFTTNMGMQGREPEAQVALEIAMREVRKAVEDHKLPDTLPILIYKKSAHVTLTASELAQGLATLAQPRPAAILFGLEQGLTGTAAATVTWRQAIAWRNAGQLTERAEQILSKQPRHLLCPYVFWSQNDGGRALPLFGLDSDVFAAMGMVWGELQAGYRMMAYV
ncbi:hypothetical protein [Cupriavidus campinensis]|uniref:Uncharacterized protein n=1 Tax=Cupriavidus campinensis TaxID=151783 RepID=A0ABY3ESR6_9BURK|nr:hypothetical protein [Cupriavidus campinensis]TSP13987.1 hypothetical protein FGG12_05820 [Cupriavidus campinensis]